MPNQPKTPMRGVRIDDDTWAKIKELADRQDARPSDVIRDAIDEYLSRYLKQRPRGGKRRQQQAT